jgi:hypothetical protein
VICLRFNLLLAPRLDMGGEREIGLDALMKSRSVANILHNAEGLLWVESSYSQAGR